MRRLAPDVLTLTLFLFGCAAEATAQRRRPRPQQATVTPTPAAERAAVSIERDAEDGSTTVKLEPFTVEENKAAKSRLMLSAHTRREAAAGDKAAAAPPQFVHLTLLSRAPRCRFPPRADVQLVLDGAPVLLKFQPDSSTTATTATLEVVTVFAPKAEGVLWVESNAEGVGECAESLAATLSPQTFARLAAARSAALKVGAAYFPLNAQTLAALRELGGRVKQ